MSPQPAAEPRSAPHPVIRRLPRRHPIVTGVPRAADPALKLATEEPPPPFLPAIGRSIRWLVAGFRYSLWSLWARIRGNVSERERGRHIRRSFESAGGLALKIGLEISLRRDLLSYEVCDELSRMGSDRPPLPQSYVAKAIEDAAGKPLERAFASFNPTPIYSGLTACVYRADLPSGKAVVVKVRRPGLRRQLAAELRCLQWFAFAPEFLMVVRPELFQEVRDSLRKSLRDEIDFSREARNQRVFRVWARRSRPSWLSAPRVYGAYTSPEVMVSEEVKGICVSDLVALVESGDRSSLAALRAEGVTPRKVALRLLQAEFWGYFEALFFQSNPAPSDIVIRPGSKLIYRDFGACASLTRNFRTNYRELMNRLLEADAAGMAEVALQLLAPLPPVDVYELKKAIESELHRFIFAIRDRSSAWWERGSGSLWFAILNAARRFRAPARLQLLRAARASLLYQAAAFRLDSDLRLIHAYRRHVRAEARRKASRYRRRVSRVTVDEFAARLISRAGDAKSAARRAAWAASAISTDVGVTLSSTIRKAAYAAQVFLQFGGRTAVIFAVSGIIGLIWRTVAHLSPESTWLQYLWRHVWTGPAVLILTAISLVVAIRRVLFRLDERDLETYE